MISLDVPTRFDVTPMYRGLENIPNLNSLGLSVGRSTPMDVVVPLLDMYADTLRDLSLYMMDTTFQSADVVFDCVKSHFPHLQALNVAFATDPNLKPPQDLGSTPDFVRDHLPRLTSLEVDGKPLSRDAVFASLKPPGPPSGPYERLRYMKLALESLTPDLFSLFALALSNLEDLKLSTRTVKNRHTSPDSMDEEYQVSSNLYFHLSCSFTKDVDKVTHLIHFLPVLLGNVPTRFVPLDSQISQPFYRAE